MDPGSPLAALGFAPGALVASATIALLAGFVRGFTGFGFALAAVPGLTLLVEPALVVPSVLALQVVAGVHLVPATIRDVDWRSVLPILAAAIAVTPAGTLLLARVPPDAMRAAIGGLLLAAVAVLWRPRPSRPAGMAVRLATGIASGLLNGSTAMSGPPVIAYFVRAASPRVARASMLAYFLLVAIAGVASAALAGQVTRRAILLAAWLLPSLVLGTALGHRAFAAAADDQWRRVVLGVLGAVAGLAILRAAAGA